VKILSKVTTIFDHVLGGMVCIACVILGCTMLIVCTAVVMRYFLSSPIRWVFDVSEYALLWLTFLGAAWVLEKEGHIKLDLVLTRLSPKNLALFGIITSILGTVVCLVIAWYSGQVALDYFQRGVLMSKAIMVPKAPIFIIIPIGSFLLFIQFLRRTFRYVGNWSAT